MVALLRNGILSMRRTFYVRFYLVVYLQLVLADFVLDVGIIIAIINSICGLSALDEVLVVVIAYVAKQDDRVGIINSYFIVGFSTVA